MCTSPINLVRRFKDGSSITSILPCGKCAECRAKRQSEFAALSCLEAQSAGSVGFLTLTYDDAHLPYMYTTCITNEDNEDLEILAQVCSRDSVPSSEFTHVYPTLYRRDVQLWLKRFRTSVFRERGERLDLRFTCFGEYGEKRHRPHYHLLIYGLSDSYLHRLAKSWPYGFTDLKIVPHFNNDGSDAFVKVSRYVSKYVSKGDVLPDFVQKGFVEKPRRQSSVKLGRRELDIEHLRNFILAATLMKQTAVIEYLSGKSDL